MCRIVAVIAEQPVAIADLLLEERNALVNQSVCDSNGVSHRDGWGIGYFRDGALERVRSAEPAGEDVEFVAAARAIHGSPVIAHIRDASVGTKMLANAHPFIAEGWLFAHNGTITGFDKLAPHLLSGTAPRLEDLREGTTDSEHAMLWLVTRFLKAGITADGAERQLPRIADIVRHSIRDLVTWTTDAEPEKPAKLNFVFTNGRMLIATRWRNNIHWQRRPATNTRAESVVVASEPIGDQAWQEIPEQSMLTLDAHLRSEISPL